MNLKSVERIKWKNPQIAASKPVTDKIFEFSEDYVLKMKVKSRGKWYDFEEGIPKGYLYDKRTSWPLRKRDGLCESGAAPHDADYETKGHRKFIQEGIYLKIDGKISTMNKKAADDLYELRFDLVKKHSTEPERDKFWLVTFGWLYWGKTKRAIRKIRKTRNK